MNTNVPYSRNIIYFLGPIGLVGAAQAHRRARLPISLTADSPWLDAEQFHLDVRLNAAAAAMAYVGWRLQMSEISDTCWVSLILLFNFLML